MTSQHAQLAPTITWLRMIRAPHPRHLQLSGHYLKDEGHLRPLFATLADRVAPALEELTLTDITQTAACLQPLPVSVQDGRPLQRLRRVHLRSADVASVLDAASQGSGFPLP